MLRKWSHFAVAGLLAVAFGARAQFFQPDIPEHDSYILEVEAETETWLRLDPGNRSFLVFLTETVGSDGGPGFAQLSIENQKIGIDHVLNIELHHRLEQQFRDFAKSRNLEVQDMTTNGVRFLRIEPENPGEAVMEVLRQVHGVDETVDLVVFGEVEDGT